jgi:hypothetical protein
MTAMLELGKSNSNLPAREVITCAHTGCEFSYTLSYTDDEIRMAGTEKNVEKMRRMAVEIIGDAHPPHLTKTYLWKAVGQGPECRWMEADSAAARAAL